MSSTHRRPLLALPTFLFLFPSPLKKTNFPFRLYPFSFLFFPFILFHESYTFHLPFPFFYFSLTRFFPLFSISILSTIHISLSFLHTFSRAPSSSFRSYTWLRADYTLTLARRGIGKAARVRQPSRNTLKNTPGHFTRISEIHFFVYPKIDQFNEG